MHISLSIVVIFCDLNRGLPLRLQQKTHKRTFTLLQIYLGVVAHLHYYRCISNGYHSLCATCLPLSRCGAHSHSHSIGLFTFFTAQWILSCVIFSYTITFIPNTWWRNSPPRFSIPANTALKRTARPDLSVSAAFRLSGRAWLTVMFCSPRAAGSRREEAPDVGRGRFNQCTKPNDTMAGAFCFLPSFVWEGRESQDGMVLFFGWCSIFLAAAASSRRPVLVRGYTPSMKTTYPSVHQSVMMTV